MGFFVSCILLVGFSAVFCRNDADAVVQGMAVGIDVGDGLPDGAGGGFLFGTDASVVFDVEADGAVDGDGLHPFVDAFPGVKEGLCHVYAVFHVLDDVQEFIRGAVAAVTVGAGPDKGLLGGVEVLDVLVKVSDERLCGGFTVIFPVIDGDDDVLRG